MAIGQGIQSLIPKKENNGSAHEEKRDQQEKRIFPANEEVKRNKSDAEDYEHTHTQKIHDKQESIFHIEINKIKSNPYQPRHEFNKEELDELKESIKEFGVIQPITVSKIIKETDTGTDVEYQLIAGERRLMASRLAGLERIPAIVKKIDTSRAKLEIALIENIQRTNLNALESAKAYARLQDEFDLTQREIAIKIGKSRESIANTMRLLQLPSNIQEALSKGKINESQARTLLSIQDPHKQQITFEKIMGQKTTVRELREKATEHIQTNPEHGFWEKRIEEKLGAPVKIDEHLGRGKISIHFYSKEEKDSILGKLAPEDEF